MPIDKTLTVGGVALVAAGTAFLVGAFLLDMALGLPYGGADAVYLALAGVAGGVGLGCAAAVGALLVLVVGDDVAPDRRD